MAWENIGHYFLENYIHLFLLALLGVLLSFPSKTRGVRFSWFWAAFGVSFAITIQCHLVATFYEWGNAIGLLIMTFLGYIMRPLVLAFACFAFTDRPLRLALLSIPLWINLAIFQTAFYSPIAFSFDEALRFSRGPACVTVFIVTLFYLFALFCFVFYRQKNARKRETPLMIVGAIGFFGAALLDVFEESFTAPRAHVLAPLVLIFVFILLRSQDADRDPLTGLLNRQSLYQDEKRLSNMCKALLYLDLDNLKTINDCFGHERGDEALHSVGEVLLEKKGNDSFAYRWGGDEFLIAFTKGKEEEVLRIAEEISWECALRGYHISYGLVMKRGKETYHDLLKKADELLYEAKKKRVNKMEQERK